MVSLDTQAWGLYTGKKVLSSRRGRILAANNSSDERSKGGRETKFQGSKFKDPFKRNSTEYKCLFYGILLIRDKSHIAGKGCSSQTFSTATNEQNRWILHKTLSETGKKTQVPTGENILQNLSRRKRQWLFKIMYSVKKNNAQRHRTAIQTSVCLQY